MEVGDPFTLPCSVSDLLYAEAVRCDEIGKKSQVLSFVFVVNWLDSSTHGRFSEVSSATSLCWLLLGGQNWEFYLWPDLQRIDVRSN